jgi:hypothetical protein
VNDLRSIAALQARVYEFLEQQDESTLQAIASGELRLAVAHADGSSASVGPAPRTYMPFGSRPDPVQAAQDLSRLASEQERRQYLKDAELTVGEMRKVAKELRLRRFSSLTKAALVDRLAIHGLDQTEAPASEPGTHEPSSPDPIDDSSAAEDQVTSQEAEPAPAAPSPDTAGSNADAAAIALRLRETDTEDEGAAYLQALNLDHKSLLAVATELQLTRVDRLSQKELRRRVLKQAIGARRKFAGLRKW